MSVAAPKHLIEFSQPDLSEVEEALNRAFTYTREFPGSVVRVQHVGGKAWTELRYNENSNVTTYSLGLVRGGENRVVQVSDFSQGEVEDFQRSHRENGR